MRKPTSSYQLCLVSHSLSRCSPGPKVDAISLPPGQCRWEGCSKLPPSWGLLQAGTGCPGRLCSLHPGRYSKAVWTWSWATNSRGPCLSRGSVKTASRGPFQPQPFCCSVCSCGGSLTPLSQVCVRFSVCVSSSQCPGEVCNLHQPLSSPWAPTRLLLPVRKPTGIRLPTTYTELVEPVPGGKDMVTYHVKTLPLFNTKPGALC